MVCVKEQSSMDEYCHRQMAAGYKQTNTIERSGNYVLRCFGDTYMALLLIYYLLLIWPY